MYTKYIKRTIDLFLSIFALIIFSPLLVLIALLVRIKLGSPIIFKQQRVGKDEMIFSLYKFRTMTNRCDGHGELLPDEIRLTSFGKVLRSTSLDELPELINILKGELSIIGPRPLILQYLPYYTVFERKRHSVRAGLVPPEILYGDVTPTWERQFEYEVGYADNISFILDLKILIATLKGVLKRNSLDYGGYIRKSLVEERIKKRESIIRS
jgi:lipopolysaccharide/colanic/teichoic acid biosynthesis glycosyltransferase